MHARRRDQGRDQIVIVVVFDAQEQLGIGKRNRFARRGVKRMADMLNSSLFVTSPRASRGEVDLQKRNR